MYCLQRGARRSGCEQGCELTIVIWVAALYFGQTLLTLKSNTTKPLYSRLKSLFLSTYAYLGYQLVILQWVFMFFHHDTTTFAVDVVLQSYCLVWIQIRRAYPQSQLHRLGFVDFARLTLICYWISLLGADIYFWVRSLWENWIPHQKGHFLFQTIRQRRELLSGAVGWRSILPLGQLLSTWEVLRNFFSEKG